MWKKVTIALGGESCPSTMSTWHADCIQPVLGECDTVHDFFNKCTVVQHSCFPVLLAARMTWCEVGMFFITCHVIRIAILPSCFFLSRH
jgi:hypothetical protein